MRRRITKRSIIKFSLGHNVQVTTKLCWNGTVDVFKGSRMLVGFNAAVSLCYYVLCLDVEFYIVCTFIYILSSGNKWKPLGK